MIKTEAREALQRVAAVGCGRRNLSYSLLSIRAKFYVARAAATVIGTQERAHALIGVVPRKHAFVSLRTKKGSFETGLFYFVKAFRTYKEGEKYEIRLSFH